MKKPNLFIVGAPKCGTTSLCKYLAVHPEIFMCRPKEPFFFGSDFTKPAPRSEAEYLNLFQPAENQRFRAEGTTWYLCSKTAAEEIKKFSPDSKIVIMLRKPSDLLTSLFNFRLYTGRENAGTLDYAFEIEADRIAKKIELPPGTDLFAEQFAYSEVIRFGSQVRRFLDCFGSDNVHIILYDDFKKDTPAEFDRVLQFLDLQPLAQFPDFKIHNKGGRNRYPFLKRFLNKPPLWVSKIARFFLPGKETRKKIYRSLVSWNRTEVNKNVEIMTPKLRRQISEIVSNDLAALEFLLGRDLSNWK